MTSYNRGGSLVDSQHHGAPSLDLNPLLRLKEALEGAQKNTQRMIGKLDRFEKRLGDLDQRMKPIQDTTEKYTKARDNISLTLTEVGRTYEYFRLANEVEAVIHEGLTASNQSDYFDALHKLSNAKTFFEQNRDMKSSASVLSNIQHLLQLAIAACAGEFEKLLNTAGKSVELVEGQYQIVNPLDEHVLKDVKSLCDAFELNRHVAHFAVYQNARVTRLKAELKAVESQHNAAWQSALYTEDPYAKGSPAFNDFYLFSYVYLRSEYMLWGSTLPVSEDSLKCYVAICDACIAELQRVLSPITSLSSFETAKATVNPVIKQSKLLLMRLDILEIFCSRYDDFRDVCHPDARHESSASLALKAMRKQMVDVSVKSVEFLVSSSIGDGFKANKKHDHEQDAMACDLHPATGNLIYCVKELSQYNTVFRKYVQDAINAQQMSSALVLPSDVDDLVCMLLENLFVALETRAEQYDENHQLKQTRRSIMENAKSHALYENEDRGAEVCILSARKHLFLVNNLHAMAGIIREKKKDFSTVTNNADNMAAAKLASKRGAMTKAQRIASTAERVENRLTSEQNLFCETIAMALGMGSQDMSEFRSAYENERATTNQHRLIKAKFAIFNSGMEALLAQQGEWRVSSSSLRETLTTNLLGRVVSAYSNFFANYSVVKFSKKHMSEYLKFTPAQLENHLKGFFGRVQGSSS